MGVISSFFSYNKDIIHKETNLQTILNQADDFINKKQDIIIYKQSIETLNNQLYFDIPNITKINDLQLINQSEFSNILLKNSVYYEMDQGIDILNTEIVKIY